MNVIHIGSRHKALDAIRGTRQKLSAAYGRGGARVSIGDRKTLLAEICDLYDEYADRSGFSDRFTNESVTDLDRHHHDAIEDLLFQLTCTPAGSRLVEAKLTAVYEKIEEHFRVREQRLLNSRLPDIERRKLPVLDRLLNPASSPAAKRVPVN